MTTSLPDLSLGDLGLEWRTESVAWIWSSSQLVAVGREELAGVWWERFGGPLLSGGLDSRPGLLQVASVGEDQDARYRYLVDVRGRVSRIGPVPAIGILRGSPSDLLPRVVVSGAQTGADRGALDAALDLGWPTAGWVPSGWRAEDGVIPERFRATLRASGWRSYAARTRQNVALGTGTLIVSPDVELTGGSWQTRDFARSHRRPCLHVRPQEAGVADRVLAWIAEQRVGVLNVAGPRESRHPGIYRAARDLIVGVLASVASRPEDFRG